jgi:hypothetical protein
MQQVHRPPALLHVHNNAAVSLTHAVVPQEYIAWTVRTMDCTWASSRHYCWFSGAQSVGFAFGERGPSGVKGHGEFGRDASWGMGKLGGMGRNDRPSAPALALTIDYFCLSK